MKQINWITGIAEEPKRREPDEPTEAYILGWNDGMHYGTDAVNPYPQCMSEYHEWEAGCDDAIHD